VIWRHGHELFGRDVVDLSGDEGRSYGRHGLSNWRES
jgi:hypothetical protein